jgi:uncharacterized membrane protein
MWTRKALKEKGKASFRANYWKAVLVSLVLTGAMFGSFTWNYSPSNMGQTAYPDNAAITSEDSMLELDDEGGFTLRGDDGEVVISSSGEDADGNQNLSVNISDSSEGDAVTINVDSQDLLPGITPAIVAGFGLTLLVVFALCLVMYAFIYNPLQAGCRGFFVANLNRPAQVREAVGIFDHGYVNCVKAMILRDVFTFLWTLLLIIRGIIKSYEYRMIPYLVADNPDMTYKEAFAESKRLMHGNKWKAFVLDLSFIGWWLLSALTLGLLAIFYVSPYYSATSAALYEELLYGNKLPGFANEQIPQSPAPAIPIPESDPWRGAHASQK